MKARQAKVGQAKPVVAVSDHALVRWLERTGAADLEPLRARLAASLGRAAVAAGTLDAAEFLILADGLVYVVKQCVVITVLPDDGRHGGGHARMHARRDAKVP